MKIVKNTVNQREFPIGTEVEWNYYRGSYYLSVKADNFFTSYTVFGCPAKKDGTNRLAGKTILINDKRGILEIEY